VTNPRKDWQQALVPSADCIDVTRFGEELDAAALAHVESCARCQAELALYREVTRDDSSAEEDDAARWIAGELRSRLHTPVNVTPANVTPDNVTPFRRKSLRPLYAVAAAILMVIGASYFLQLRDPSIDTNVPDATYRSARIAVIAPAGDLATAPNELRWTAIPNASRYHVAIVEVDATPVWAADTTQPYVTLPPQVIAQFAPGKTLLWTVEAYRGNEMLATSPTQNARVIVSPSRKTP
jgi:hypothetical protein